MFSISGVDIIRERIPIVIGSIPSCSIFESEDLIRLSDDNMKTNRKYSMNPIYRCKPLEKPIKLQKQDEFQICNEAQVILGIFNLAQIFYGMNSGSFCYHIT